MIQRQVCYQLLQPTVLIFQLPQPPQLADLEDAVLCLSSIERGVADAVLAADLGDLLARLDPLENVQDLRLAEVALAHVLARPPDSATHREFLTFAEPQVG